MTRIARICEICDICDLICDLKNVQETLCQRKILGNFART